MKTQKQVILTNLKKQGITEANLPQKLKEINSGLTTAQSGLDQIEKQEKALKKIKRKWNLPRKRLRRD